MVHWQTSLRSGVARGVAAGMLRTALSMILALGLVGAATASHQPRVLHVANDPGGDFTARMRFIDGLRGQDMQVQIGAGYCLGACTLYLGLSQTCVSPEARFGFARAIAPGATRAALRDYYPAALDSLVAPVVAPDVAADRLGFHEVSGRVLIDLGVASCDSAPPA